MAEWACIQSFPSILSTLPPDAFALPRTLKDLDSKTGTFINDFRVPPGYPLPIVS